MYNIKVNNEQLKVMSEALELYSRLKCGQINTLKDIFWKEEYDRESVDYALHQIKILIFPKLHQNESLGIYGSQTPKDAKLAYGIYKNAQHQLHKDDEHWSVYKDYPMEVPKELMCEVREIDGI